MSEENVRGTPRGNDRSRDTSTPATPKSAGKRGKSQATVRGGKDTTPSRGSEESRRRASLEKALSFPEKQEDVAGALGGQEDQQGREDGAPQEGSARGSPRSSGQSREGHDSKEVSVAGSQHPSGRGSADEAVSANDAYNAEFSYYCAVLRTYAPSLSREYDKTITRLWMRKLFGPEYHPAVLKPKRNKYLLYLSITIYNDEAYGIFRQEPPCGKLPEIKDIPFERDFPPAAWETEVQWTDTLSELPEELKLSECYLHDQDGCPPQDEKMAEALDAEFQFFLWLSKPYVALLPDPEEKTTAACWIQLLCGVGSQKEDCVALKEIRNDYMQTLLGYVHDLRVEGPFRLMPPEGPLPPLALLYEDCQEDADYADPMGSQAEQFLAIQRLPESGAFAYINVTGELFGNL